MTTPDPKPQTARERIAKLRAAFLEQLPARIDKARSLLEQITTEPESQTIKAELHRLLHSLKGTGRSFGFRELGLAASLGEALLAKLIEAPADRHHADWLGELSRCLAELETTTAALCRQGGSGIEDDPGFCLPVSAEPDGLAGDEKRRRLVYLCDDEPLVLEQLACQLGCFGYETESFTEPAMLYAAALRRQPDAVVMDINFPQGEQAGTDALEALKGQTSRPIRSIFLSSRDDFAARLAAVKAGGEAYFRKPAQALSLVAALDELTGQHEPEPYRILIVDDEPDIGDYHSIILQEAGMITRRVSDAKEVLEVLKEFNPDMVLMDMYMPCCDGRDLAQVIRQVPNYVGLPIVYLSSETDRSKQFTAMRGIGAEGFLTKPVVPGELVAAVAIRAERMRTLRSLMARDSLTGLFSHTTTTQLLETAINSARRERATLCFAMLDIDHFKSVNDRYGHPVGDQVIQAMARVLQQRLRNSDVVGRYGGEEFAVVLRNVDTKQAARLLDGLRDDFAKIDFHSAAGDFSCTFSAGIASFPEHDSMESIREAADRALYQAKRGGRNQVAID